MIYWTPRENCGVGPPSGTARIMYILRVIMDPFHANSLILVGVFAILFSIFDLGGIYGIFASIITQIWVVKYCYVLTEHIADGAQEPERTGGT